MSEEKFFGISMSEEDLLATKFPDEIEISSDQIPKYQEFVGLKNFACRAIIAGGKMTNEYHVKPIGRISPTSLAAVMRGIIDESEFTLTDPDNLLKLEWPIMMKVSSILGNEIIEDTLKEVDKFLEANNG